MSSLRFGAAIAILAVLSLGCEESLSPNSGIERPFAMYGVLSPELDTQSVQLFLSEDKLTAGTSDTLQAVVQSVDIETGERRTWRDSVLTLPGGEYRHVFWSPFRVDYGRTYRIEAIRTLDGAMSFADVHVPPRVSVRIDESDAPLVHVFVDGEDFRLLSPEAVYDVSRPIDHPETGEFQPVLTYRIAYTGLARQEENGWAVTFNLIVDAAEVNSLYNGTICRGPICGGECILSSGHSTYVFLEELGIRAIVASPQWNPPGGVFDPNVLAQPGVLSNVENGFGFVGAGYELEEMLEASRETVLASCFRYSL